MPVASRNALCGYVVQTTYGILSVFDFWGEYHTLWPSWRKRSRTILHFPCKIWIFPFFLFTHIQRKICSWLRSINSSDKTKIYYEIYELLVFKLKYTIWKWKKAQYIFSHSFRFFSDFPREFLCGFEVYRSGLKLFFF